MGIHQRGKSNSIKELLVRIARPERKKATLARSTYGDYRSIWKKYVLPYFGNMPLCRVTRLDVEEFVGNLPDISAKRKNNIMVTLKCLFNNASRRGEIDEPPSENIRRLKERKPFTDPFSFRGCGPTR